MFAGNIQGRTQTLPLVVYSEFQSSLDASVAAAAVLVTAAFGVLVAVRLTRWRTGARRPGHRLAPRHAQVAAARGGACGPRLRPRDACSAPDPAWYPYAGSLWTAGPIDRHGSGGSATVASRKRHDRPVAGRFRMPAGRRRCCIAGLLSAALVLPGCRHESPGSRPPRAAERPTREAGAADPAPQPTPDSEAAADPSPDAGPTRPTADPGRSPRPTPSPDAGPATSRRQRDPAPRPSRTSRPPTRPGRPSPHDAQADRIARGRPPSRRPSPPSVPRRNPRPNRPTTPGRPGPGDAPQPEGQAGQTALAAVTGRGWDMRPAPGIADQADPSTDPPPPVRPPRSRAHRATGALRRLARVRSRRDRDADRCVAATGHLPTGRGRLSRSLRQPRQRHPDPRHGSRAPRRWHRREPLERRRPISTWSMPRAGGSCS